MRMSRLVRTLAPLLALALPVTAELVKFKEWDKSPEFLYLTTDAEKKAWKNVKTDEDGEKFVGLFWAKRDPDIKTPENEFRLRFETLAKKADELFALGKKRGALTERGKLFILVGPPKSMAQKAESSLDVTTTQQTGFGAVGGGGQSMVYQFLYEQPQLPEWADVKTLDAKFRVDTGVQTESLIDFSPVKRIEKMVVERALKNPDLKEVPVYKTREQFEAEQRAAAEAAAEKNRGPVLSPDVRKVLEDLLAKEPSGDLTLWPISEGEGSGKLELQLVVPAAAVNAPELCKLALLFKTKDGKDAARREETAGLLKSKGDYFVDRALMVLPGEIDAAVAVLGSDGKVLASGRGKATVPDFPTDFSLSPVVLSVNDFPADGAKKGDPFVFAMRKFVAKKEGNLERTDGLSYLVRVYNPEYDAVTGKATLQQALKVKPKNGLAQDLPAPEPNDFTKPKDNPAGRTAVDIAYSIVDTNVGEYFRGEFELKVKITDKVSGKSLDVSVPFRVPTPPPAPPAKKK